MVSDNQTENGHFKPKLYLSEQISSHNLETISTIWIKSLSTHSLSAGSLALRLRQYRSHFDYSNNYSLPPFVIPNSRVKYKISLVGFNCAT